MAAAVVGLAVLTRGFGERIGINDGTGWDGQGYTMWAQEFWKHVVTEGLQRYHAQRVLPSALAHLGMRVAGAAPTVPNAIAAFTILDAIVLAGAAALWAHLGHAMRWRRAAIWAGFVALFLGFANARHAFYYPTLTDPTAFFLGMLLAWGYLLDRPIAVWLVALLGTVTWPALPPLAIAMLLLPRAEVEPGTPRRWLAAIVALLGAAVFVYLGRKYTLHPVPDVGDDKMAEWVLRPWLWVTIPLLVAMLFAGCYTLGIAPRLWNARGYLRTLRWRREAIAVIGVVAILVWRHYYLAKVGRNGEGPTGAQFLCEHTLSAFRGPLWGPVFQVVYFGPIVLVSLIYWRRIAEVASSWGPAALLALALTVAFAAGSNSRQWNHLVPFLVAATIAATDERWTTRRTLLFAAIALPWSKLWLKIGYDQHIEWRHFPNQRYFMEHGPYASDETFVAHLAAAVVTGALLWLLLHRWQRGQK